MAIEKTIELNVDSKKATKGLKDLEKGIDGVNKEVKQTSQSTKEMNSTLDQATGGAVTKFNKFKGTLKGVIGSFKTLRGAIIGTGIGALLIAVTSLGAAFTRSEEGQNKFAKILGVISSVTGNLLDLLADLGENIISVFENPKQAIIDFKDLIVENITNRFNAILDTVGFLGSAISKVFSKDFKGALEDAKKAGSSFVDSFTGVENSIDKATNSVKEFGKEIKSDAIAAAKIADQRANAEKKARDLIVERAEAERKIAELREKAVNKDKFTAQERIKFLEEAGRISDELAAKEVQVAKLRLEAKQTENALTKSNKDDLNEAAQLEASVIQLETQRLNLQKRLSTELLTSRREVTAEEKANIKELSDLKKTLRDAEAVSEQEKRELELVKIQEHYDNLIAQANENNIKTDELEAARDEAKRLKQEEFDVKDAERKQKKLDDEKANSEASVQIAKAEAEAKSKNLANTENALNSLGALAGEQTAAGKGLAIASATINTYRGVSDALAAKTVTPFETALKFVNAAAILGNGLKNVQKIVSVKVPKTGGGGGGGASAGGGGGASITPPSFNVVGASETSVLADTVAEQTNEPVQAYVVSNDVTTAQSMENNIVEGATI